MLNVSRALKLAVTVAACDYSAAVARLCSQLSPLVVDQIAHDLPVDVVLDVDLVNDTAIGLSLNFLHQPHWKPLRWNFTDTAFLKRFQQASRHNEILLKVVGKNAAKAKIIDATGGRGWDALLLAKTGAQVTVCERDPLIFALLMDAQQRAAAHPLLAPHLARMQWLCIDAVGHLQQTQPDIVYCDPMFPARTKTALNQKNLLALQQWVGHGEKEQLLTLMQQALTSAKQRVILKYAAHQPLPLILRPTDSIEGRGHRWYRFLTANS